MRSLKGIPWYMWLVNVAIILIPFVVNSQHSYRHALGMFFIAIILSSKNIYDVQKRTIKEQNAIANTIEELHAKREDREPEHYEATADFAANRILSWFFFSIVLILSLTFLLLDFLSLYFRTGIHIPIVLFIGGMGIRGIQKALGIKDDTPMKDIVLYLSLSINYCMMFVNWRLALLILAIIVGKTIWLDGVFDYPRPIDAARAMSAWFSKFRNDDGIFKYTQRYCDQFILVCVILFVAMVLLENVWLG